MTLGPHLLGRVRPPDERHLELHPLEVVAPPPQGIEVSIQRPSLSVYDQGQTPRCVGYSISKIMNHFNRYAFDADWLYAEAKKIDGDPQDGTSARYACDVLRAKGHWRTISGNRVKSGPQLKHGIASNTWALSVDAIRAVFARPAPEPVAIGIDWYNAWFNPDKRSGGEWWLEPPAGSVAGGHEIGIWACSDRRQAFGLSNTWGSEWPNLVWLPYATMAQLFTQGADACVISDLATR